MADVALPFTLTNATTADATQVMANFVALRNALNDLDAENLSAALAASLGLSQVGSVRQGVTSVAAEQSTASAAYTALSTPDRVSGIVVPVDGLIAVDYRALWKCSGGTFGRAALFIGGNQVQALGQNASGAQEAVTPNTSNVYRPLISDSLGLLGHDGDTAHSGFATTGLSHAAIAGAPGFALLYAIGGVSQSAPAGTFGGGIWVGEVAAGTYDVSVQFKTSAGSVFAKERKLRVWTMFAP